MRKYKEAVVILKCEYLADCFGNTAARSFSFLLCRRMSLQISQSKIHFAIKIIQFIANEE